MRKHIHKLKRINLGTNKDYFVYKCQRPGCTTYYVPTMCPGLIALCFSCDKDFVLSKRNMEQVKPKCTECTGKSSVEEDKEPVNQQATDAILAALRNFK